MINVKYPRRGFVVEEVIQGCCCETAEKFVVIPWEDYGEDNFNNMTEGVTIGEYGSDGSADDYTEGECSECEESVVYKDYFIVTSDANAIKTAEEAVDYAVDVLKSPFPEGEALIATDAESSYSYADCVLHAPFPLGEAAIATNAQYSYEYSRDVLHAPFPLGEAVIATNAHIFKMYKELFPEPQATPEPQAQAPATSMSDKQKEAIKDSFEIIEIKTENIIFLDIDHLREHLPKEYFMRLLERWSWFGKGVGNGGVSNLKNLIRIMELNLKNVDIPIDEKEKVKSVIEAVKELKCDMVHEGFYE